MRSHSLIHNLRLIASFALVGCALFALVGTAGSAALGNWAFEGELLRSVGAVFGAGAGVVFVTLLRTSR